MREIFEKVARHTSKYTTYTYSTSFSLGVRSLAPALRDPICGIYGFVRFADEIVDTFHEFPQEELLKKFKQDTYEAIEVGISLNPILHSFQAAVNKYNIEKELIDTFLDSMEMDLSKSSYESVELDKYILGSAEVVGLMCLRVFVGGDAKRYEELTPYAMKLGAAFQKVNFLRDLKNDYAELGRAYFPDFDWANFDEAKKTEIENDIENDFNEARIGIMMLPRSARFGVFLAYSYYVSLFKKIKRKKPKVVMEERIRIPNSKKIVILASTYVKHKFNLIH